LINFVISSVENLQVSVGKKRSFLLRLLFNPLHAGGPRGPKKSGLGLEKVWFGLGLASTLLPFVTCNKCVL